VPDDPIQLDVSRVDLTHRFPASTVVVASPAAAAETIIAQLAITESEAIVAGVELNGWAALTVGATGTAVRLRIRRTNLAGAVVADTGALTGGIAAAGLVAQDVAGIDPAPVPAGQVYVLTLQVTGGSGVSTVSAVSLNAIAD
jgi:hypothetical protein